MEEHTRLYPVLAGEITPSFFIGMFDQHNMRHAQEFVSNQLIDYVKYFLTWKQEQQGNNDWIVNPVTELAKQDAVEFTHDMLDKKIEAAVKDRQHTLTGKHLI